MTKNVSASMFTEQKGLDRISQIAYEIHCLFRGLSQDDVGIDGEIEVLTAKPDGNGFQTAGALSRFSCNRPKRRDCEKVPKSTAPPGKTDATGRVGDLVELDLHGLVLSERSGSVTFQHGKGNKQRSCTLLVARPQGSCCLSRKPPARSIQ